MGLLDDFSKREARVEAKPEPPVVGHYGVKLDLNEEKVSLTAGQTKEYPVVVTNTGTEDDTIRLKIDLIYNAELPDPPEWTVKLYGVEDKVWDVTFTKPIERETAGDPKNYFLDSYTYHHWGTYGSPEIERRQNAIAEIKVAEDGRRVSLIVLKRETRRVFHLQVKGLKASDGSPLLHNEAWYTMNAVP